MSATVSPDLFEFRLPDLGEGIHEAQVLAWEVRPGDAVQPFQALCQVESAKAAVELTSPVGGRVRETRVPEGATAHLGDVLVVIDTSGSPFPGGEGRGEGSGPLSAGERVEVRGYSSPPALAPESWEHPSPGLRPVPPPGAAPLPPGEAVSHPLPVGEARGGESSLPEPDEYFGIVGRPPQAAEAPPAEERRVFAAPYVRRLAHDLDVRLEDVPGTGPQGRVRASDVESYAARRGVSAAPSGSPSVPAPSAQPSERPAPAETSGATSPAPPERPPAAPLPGHPTAPPQRGASGPADTADAPDERVPLQGLRKRIAEHMLEAVRQAPQVTSMDLFDVTDLVRARELLRATAEADGVKLTYLPFVVKAVVEALKAQPYANAVLDESRGEIVLKRAYNIGFATAVPDGLVVPVVKHADRQSLLEIAREIGRLTETARARRASPEDLAGGTFTISSFGGFGGSPLYATPILNYPEVAILGVGRIEEQPRVVDGQIVPRHCMGVSFTFDHRVLDGEGASRFLSVLRRYLERPLELLLRLR